MVEPPFLELALRLRLPLPLLADPRLAERGLERERPLPERDLLEPLRERELLERLLLGRDLEEPADELFAREPLELERVDLPREVELRELDVFVWAMSISLLGRHLRFPNPVPSHQLPRIWRANPRSQA
jgi:hypothetical protein